MQLRSRRLFAGFLVSTTLTGALCPPVGAQVAVRPGGAAKIGLTELALNRLVGRFRWPITCVQPGGESRQLEEAIVFRLSRALYKGSPAVRATLFGIEAPGASVCLNRVTPRLSDVRGVLYLTFYSHGTVSYTHLRAHET